MNKFGFSFSARCEIAAVLECDCEQAITVGVCIDYDVSCPPTEQVPAGHTLVPVSEANTCDQLIPGSVCNKGSGLCICEADDLRYGGPACYPNIRGKPNIALTTPNSTIR